MTDEERFEGVFADHFDAVLRFALARVEPDTARDVASETFLAAWQARGKLPPEPRGWLLAAARRRIADHYRARGRRDSMAAEIAGRAPVSSPDHAEHVAQSDGIRTAFGRLRQADGELLRLLAWDGLTRSEAAQVLGCSSSLFAVRLHRARRRLRAELDRNGPPPDPIIRTLVAEEAP